MSLTKIYSYKIEIRSQYSGDMRVRALGILLCALLLQALFFPEANGLSDPAAKIIRAEDILEKIEAGAPIDYNNVIIEGDLNLSHLQLSSKHKKRSDFEQEISGQARC
jgi:hypothetical protein